MEQLKNMKENLMCAVETQMNGNLSAVDTKELGEAVDMIKDLSEAIYYCTITEAMEKNDQNKQHEMYYTTGYPMITSPEYEREMNRGRGRMYYEGGNSGGQSGSNGGSSYYGGGQVYYPPAPSYPYDTRPMMNDTDYREGRSGAMRRNYMEAKEGHKGKEIQMKELEKYMQELSGDITEMIKDASPEEKAMLQQKIATLASKIS